MLFFSILITADTGTRESSETERGSKHGSKMQGVLVRQQLINECNINLEMNIEIGFSH